MPRTKLYLVVIGFVLCAVSLVSRLQETNLLQVSDDTIHNDDEKTQTTHKSAKEHYPVEAIDDIKHHHATEENTNDKASSRPVVDIISVGSLQRVNYLEAQRETFLSHPIIRNVWTATEHNDTDPNCHRHLNASDINKIESLCHSEFPQQTKTSHLIRQRKFRPKHDVGWLCAQKRPIDALGIAWKIYEGGLAIPDYLILVDDDTYVNMESTIEILSQLHPSHVAFAISGCRLVGPKQLNFAYPVGGFGTILTKGTLQRMQVSINCSSLIPDRFTEFACWRLEENNMLEKHFFRDGMSVMDLFLAYSNALRFSNYHDWKEGAGFCFHSDIAIAYFVDYYHVTVADAVLKRRGVNDFMRQRHLGFINFNESKANAQCVFEHANCGPQSRICHYVTPKQMHRLWKASSGGEA